MTRRLIRPAALVALAALALPGLAQDRDARERITAFSSPDPVARAMAACERGRLRAAEVRPAREALLALIGDGTPVEISLCREWGNWRERGRWREWGNRRGRDETSSPGREAALALEALGTEVLPELTAFLQDSRPTAREQAAFALGLIESARSVEPLLGVLGNDPEPKVRRQAAWALGMIESAGAVESLIRALPDPEPSVREQVAWALGMIESAGAAEAIADALERETDDRVRRQLVWALGQMIDSADLDTEPSALAALLRRALLSPDR